MLLGIVEHGSRAALCLQALRDKSSWTLLGHLFLAIGQYGKPCFVRTDNEAIFTSRVFRLVLFLFGIGHQTIDLHCPWQNGRVERFFGTLKEKLDQLAVTSFDALDSALGEFRFFYNHVRPHQNLGGATPAEAWAGVSPHTARFGQEYWFEAWDGLLAGYYPKNRSCHPAHASIHLAAQDTQHERGGHQFGDGPFALSSPRSGRIEGFAFLNCGF